MKSGVFKTSTASGSAYGWSLSASPLLSSGNIGVVSTIINSDTHYVYNVDMSYNEHILLSSTFTSISSIAMPWSNIFFMGVNESNTGSIPGEFSNNKFGAFGLGEAIPLSSSYDFTKNILDLWYALSSTPVTITLPISTSPILWLDAKDTPTIFGSTYEASKVVPGVRVYSWNDKSSNAYEFIANTGGPVLSTNSITGQPVLLFRGSDRLSNSGVPTTKDFTYIAVVHSNNASGLGAITTQGTIGGFFSNNDTFVWYPTTLTIPSSSATQVISFVNSSTLSSLSAYSDSTYVGSFSSAALSSSLTDIGLNSSGSDYRGDVMEILLFAPPISDSDRLLVEGYLDTKWKTIITTTTTTTTPAPTTTTTTTPAPTTTTTTPAPTTTTTTPAPTTPAPTTGTTSGPTTTGGPTSSTTAGPTTLSPDDDGTWGTEDDTRDCCEWPVPSTIEVTPKVNITKNQITTIPTGIILNSNIRKGGGLTGITVTTTTPPPIKTSTTPTPVSGFPTSSITTITTTCSRDCKKLKF